MSKGSSLLELLIAVVLMAVVAVIATSLLFTTLGSSGKASGLVLVKQNGDHAIQYMERVIRGARSAKCDPPFNTLEINEPDDDDYRVFINHTTEQIRETFNGNNFFLTSDEVDVTSFTCSRRIGVGDEPDVIDINFTLELAPGEGPGKFVSEDFETSVSPRTYE